MGKNYKHFEGKGVVEHWVAAKEKGFRSASVLHSIDHPWHIFSGLDSAKETAVILTGLVFIDIVFSINNFFQIFCIFFIRMVTVEVWEKWSIGLV